MPKDISSSTVRLCCSVSGLLLKISLRLFFHDVKKGSSVVDFLCETYHNFVWECLAFVKMLKVMANLKTCLSFKLQGKKSKDFVCCVFKICKNWNTIRTSVPLIFKGSYIMFVTGNTHSRLMKHLHHPTPKCFFVAVTHQLTAHEIEITNLLIWICKFNSKRLINKQKVGAVFH